MIRLSNISSTFSTARARNEMLLRTLLPEAQSAASATKRIRAVDFLLKIPYFTWLRFSQRRQCRFDSEVNPCSRSIRLPSPAKAPAAPITPSRPSRCTAAPSVARRFLRETWPKREPVVRSSRLTPPACSAKPLLSWPSGSCPAVRTSTSGKSFEGGSCAHV